ncbi:class I SAM-dependent methyltransferase [Thiohalobacter thiocyanaticus]|uniref:Methyltransferase domain-containing protein n=1 Tax=Thiohalobacter thiocyanaticus TaxID=585455 RepID=A0A426QK62_9GAMM|nr:class I SAM-dependent methyltransferase [Thiohalobacter thiocyanaticus]RRQ22143.1 methyltransferase domain-containing protein [Thiohalobacter thiocyanaticus]
MTDRKSHWEAIYRDKSPLEVSWYQQEPALSLELIRHSGIAHDAPIIDVGGGASVLVDRLQAAGYTNLSVLDISTQALACARRRLGMAAEHIDWIEADITAFSPSCNYALWHDRAVFHFLTGKVDRVRYVEVLHRALPPGGQLIIAAFAIGGPEKCSGLDIIQYDADRLLAELGPGFELVETRHEAHLTPAGGEQKFSYFRFIKGAQDSAA